MDHGIATSLEPFVGWTVTALSALLGFAVGCAWLLSVPNPRRRRRSAVVDLLWTLTSAVAIIAALLTFEDLLWRDHQQRFETGLEAAWDQLAEVDGTRLVSLNCPPGKAVPPSQLDPTFAVAKGARRALLPARSRR